jgi:hypothetical protein
VRLWDAIAGAALQTLEGYSGSVSPVAFSLDAKQVVSGQTIRQFAYGTLQRERHYRHSKAIRNWLVPIL